MYALLQYRSKVTSHLRYTWQLDTLYSCVMLKTRVRVELKSRESNDLLVRVSYHFPLEIALESRIAHRLACQVLAIDTYQLACRVLVIDTHRLVCRVLAIVSHLTQELVLSCICSLTYSTAHL